MSTAVTAGYLAHASLETPAFVVDLHALEQGARRAREALTSRSSRLLFAMKAFSVERGLQRLAAVVDGFAASSLFEVQLARRVGGDAKGVHVTAPGLRPTDVEAICDLADYLSFNSLSQWRRYRNAIAGRVSPGLRVNPQLSFVTDTRYDPCRPSSKLGVPLAELERLLGSDPDALLGLEGLHFHTNCDATDLQPLRSTAERLVAALGPLFERLKWVNVGGGYLFDGATDVRALRAAERLLLDGGPQKVFMEPGAAIARSAGCVVASVVDLFESDGKSIAVLDASVNHMPEVFEYQFRPPVAGDTPDGAHAYQLAGAACLAGDLFGDYRFDTPLEIGSRVVFPERGAYSLVKANMFNGISLPTIYALQDGELSEVRRYEFEDYLIWCGGQDVARV